nr:uncharacterized mitochondrial protein AtMg00810-like [Tanacetum cinerariifolium]
MSSNTKLTKDEECESIDSTKYRGMIGTSIKTVVYADSDHAEYYVDRKSTSGICTFVGCCLTSWFSKKQIALAISTTKAEYEEHPRCCQAKGSKVKEKLVHLEMVEKFEVLIEKKKMFGRVGDEEVVVGEGVVVTSSSLEMLTNSHLGGIMVSLIFLEGLEEEA